MGAQDFFEIGAGTNAREAFERVRDQALYEYGHDTYSGTIGTKHGFFILKPPRGLAPDVFARLVSSYWPGNSGEHWGEPEPEHAGWKPEDKEVWAGLSESDKKVIREANAAVDDKWGDAGCIDLGDGHFAFLGMAPC